MAVPTNSTRNFISMQQKYDRVILLVDMDCFYCQVEEKLNPELKGKPVAVVQYNAWRGGGIIAVNYAARAKGVTRHMRGDEAKEQCPDIELVKVPNIREKADLSKYRDAGKEVANVLQTFTTLLERASVDEAYLDITEAVNKRLSEMNAGTFTLQPHELINTYAVGYERFGDYLKVITAHFANPYCEDEMFNRNYDASDIPAVRQSDVRLLLGASIASEIRTAVKSITGYECSAGIAHNKIIAKLACGMNKPNKQTIMPLSQIEQLFEKLPVGKIKGLGGKFGEEVCERLKVKTLAQILKYTELELQKKFDEKNGTWLFYISRGIDLEAVTPRFYSKSIGCCKKFPGRNNITGLNTLRHWLNELATEITERLEKDIVENNRKAKQMTISYIQEIDGEEISSSRSVPLLNYEQAALAQRSLEVIKANTKQFFRSNSVAVLNNAIKFLGISVGKFETITSGQTKLQEMFANQATKRKKTDEDCMVLKEIVQQNMLKQPASSKLEETLHKEVEPKSTLKKFFQNRITEFCNINSTNLKPESDDNDSIANEIQSESVYDATAAEPSIKSFFIAALSKNRQKFFEVPENESSDTIVEFKTALEPVEKTNVLNKCIKNDAYDSPAIKRIKLPEIESKSTTEITTTTTAAVLTTIGSSPRDGTWTTPDQGLSYHDSMETTAATTATTTTAAKNYQTQYAEYALPELNFDLLQFQQCEICGIKIPLEERLLQMHRDHHFAQELSQKQRLEFRNEIKTKVTQTKSKKNSTIVTNNTKAQKKSKETPAAAITKFLKPQLENSSTDMAEQSTTSKETQNFIECVQCKKLIDKFVWSEHLDYHVAKQLQRELNQLEVHTVPAQKKQIPSRNKKGKLHQKSASKPISQFFTQTQSRLEE